MKRILLVILVLILALTCFACKKDGPKDCNYNEYIMDINLQDDNLLCKQNFIFVNTLKEDLEELKFHLYPNAFREDVANKAYKSNLSQYGGLEITASKLNGKDINYTLSQDKDIMSVKIPKAKLNEKLELYLEYTVKLPACNLRLGKHNDMINCGNFYPSLAYYDNDKWREDGYTTVGDPFMSATANYKVTINAPADMVIACTGDIVNTAIENDRKIVSVNAEGVRDFAMVMSKKFQVMTKMVNNTTVYYYYFNDSDPASSLSVAANALKVFSDCFGKYPYKSYRVAETSFAYGGMEYPMLVYINSNASDKADVIIHETAHQWWSVLVGNDSINEGYIDEGLATFSASYYYLLCGDENRFNQDMKKRSDSFKNFINSKKAAQPDYCPKMNKALKDYDQNEYSAICYDMSCAMFKNMYDTMGKKKFEKGLRLFFEDNKYKIATGSDLHVAFTKAAGKDMGKLFNSWTLGTVQTFAA